MKVDGADLLAQGRLIHTAVSVPDDRIADLGPAQRLEPVRELADLVTDTCRLLEGKLLRVQRDGQGFLQGGRRDPVPHGSDVGESPVLQIRQRLLSTPGFRLELAAQRVPEGLDDTLVLEEPGDQLLPDIRRLFSGVTVDAVLGRVLHEIDKVVDAPLEGGRSAS